MKRVKLAGRDSKLVRRLVALFSIAMFSLYMIPQANSLPEGEQVVSGSATFDRTTADTLNINTPSDRLIVNYNSFSIAQPEAVNFYQPSSSSIALNRIVGGDPSSIFGTLTANGRIMLINPNGILFGPNSRVDVAGLVASTLDVSNSDFLNGDLTFTKYGDKIGASVINKGYLTGKNITLLGSVARNEGTIVTTLGNTTLASGEKMTLSLDTAGMISVAVDEAVKDKVVIGGEEAKDGVSNTGTIKADGGVVVLTAKVLDNIFDYAVNNSGLIQANSLVDKEGKIELTASGEDSNIVNDGTLEAIGSSSSINVNTEGLITNSGIIRTDLFKEQGYSFSTTGTIEGGDAFYSNIDGAASISGNIGSNQSDTGDLIVTGNTTLTANNLSFIADSDNTGGGNFNMNSGTSISDGVNSYNLTIRSGSDATHGTGNVSLRSIDIGGNLTVSAFGGDITQYAATIINSSHDITMSAANIYLSKVFFGGSVGDDFYAEAGSGEIKIGGYNDPLLGTSVGDGRIISTNGGFLTTTITGNAYSDAQYTNEGSADNANNDNGNPLYIEGDTGGQLWTWIKFDLNTLSAYVIDSAYLKMYVTNITPGASFPVSAYLSTNDTWDPTTITWNNQPDDYLSATATATITPVSGGYNTWNVYGDVDQELLNDGVVSWALRAQTPGNTSKIKMWGPNFNDTDKIPVLGVSYYELGSGNITLVAKGDGDTGIKDNVTLGRLLTNGDVSVTSEQGAIVDNNAAIRNIQGNNLILSAINGIGSGNALETKVANLDAKNTVGGSIEIDNTGNLTIADLNSDSTGISNKGNIILSATGDITQNADIFIDQDLATLLAPVNLTGGWSISGLKEIDVSWQLPDQTGTYSFTATAGGAYTQSGAGDITTNGGDATITAGGDVTLTLIDAGVGDVTIKTTGSIIDGDLFRPTADYDIKARTINLTAGTAPVLDDGKGTVDVSAIDIGHPSNSFAYIFDQEETVGTVDLTAGAYTAAFDDILKGWIFSTTSGLLGDTTVGHYFHVATIGGSVYSPIVDLGPFGALTVTADDKTKVYGDADPALTYQITSGGLLGDSFTGALTRDSGDNVGNYDITQGSLTINNISKYYLTFIKDTLTIDPKLVTIDGSRAYNGTADVAAGIFTISGTVGETLGLTGSGTISSPNVGDNYPVTLGTLTLTDGTGLASNYDLDSGTADITQAALTITTNDATKVEGETLVFAGTEFTSSGLVGSDLINSITLTSLGAPAPAPAGTYPILGSDAVGIGLGNYMISFNNEGILTVTSAPVVVTTAVIIPDYLNERWRWPVQEVIGTDTGTLVYAMDPQVRPIPVYLYHPIVTTDSGAFDNMGLTADMYEFIDGNLESSRDTGFSPWFEEEFKKKKR